MSKLSEIKVAQLAARKNREKLKATLLTTVIGEAEIVGKNDGGRTTTDAEVVAVLKKFEKGLNETIEYLRPTNNFEAMGIACDELAILGEFLPEKITDDRVKIYIMHVIETTGIALEQKNMGKVIPTLKEKYGEQFDGQQVSRVFKELMNVQ